MTKLSISILTQLLRYEPETGRLFWLTRQRSFFTSDREHKRWNTRYAGREAFSPNSHGYLDGMIFRKMYRAHQVAWALCYGEWPSADLDHINGNKRDNRVSNLRQVTRSQNCRNTPLRSSNSSGVMGVSQRLGRWRAYIRTNGVNRHLGTFDTLDEAASARKIAEQQFGYHENHGRVPKRTTDSRRRAA